MSATVVPSPWPSATAVAGSAGRWTFCQEVQIESPSGARTLLRWVMRRNCSLAPRQLLAVYGVLCAVSLAISLFFLLQGAPYVMAFAGVELALVGFALLVYARHAGDREVITLAGGDVSVEQQIGRRARHAQFRAEWLAVEPAQGQGSLVMLSGQGQSMRVGRFLRPERRGAFAQELRRALRRAVATPPELDRSESNPN